MKLTRWIGLMVSLEWKCNANIVHIITESEGRGYQIGVYGSYAVVEEIARRGACKHSWQKYAWSCAQLSKAANLYQYKNGQQLVGHEIDLNDGLGGEGWWDTAVQSVEKPVNNPIDKEAAEKVIGVLGALHTASADKQIQAAAHYAANSLRDAAGIPWT